MAFACDHFATLRLRVGVGCPEGRANDVALGGSNHRIRRSVIGRFGELYLTGDRRRWCIGGGDLFDYLGDVFVEPIEFSRGLIRLRFGGCKSMAASAPRAALCGHALRRTYGARVRFSQRYLL